MSLSARCCYSCRAFFRRRAKKNDNQRCRSNDGRCLITFSNKKCITCRYDKCLSVGMDPGLVQGQRQKIKREEADDIASDTEDNDEGNEQYDMNMSGDSMGPDSVPPSRSLMSPTSQLDSNPGPSSMVSPPPCHVSPPIKEEPGPSFLQGQNKFVNEDIWGQSLTHLTHNTPGFNRPSVIMRAKKNSDNRVSKRQESSKLQLQADILKFHGNILTHTGMVYSFSFGIL